MIFYQQTHEGTSSSFVQREEFDSEDSLLEPFRSSDIDESTSSSESTEQNDLNCTECDRSFRSVVGLRNHSMVQHNIHSHRKIQRKVCIWINF